MICPKGCPCRSIWLFLYLMIWPRNVHKKFSHFTWTACSMLLFLRLWCHSFRKKPLRYPESVEVLRDDTTFFPYAAGCSIFTETPITLLCTSNSFELLLLKLPNIYLFMNDNFLYLELYWQVTQQMIKEEMNWHCNLMCVAAGT